MGQTITLSQKLQQVLSPRMLQMLKRLNVSYVDLVSEVNAAVEDNPVLELARQDELFSYASSLGDYGRGATVDGAIIERELKSSAATLTQYLIDQLHFEDLDEVEYQIGEILIDNIDNRGYLEDYTKVKQEIMDQLSVKRTRVDKVLEVIHTLEPEGVGARNLKECLLIQIREYNFESDALRDILTVVVKNHLDNLAKKKYAKIAEALEIQEEGVERVAEFIEKHLTHAPGLMYRNDEQVRTVIPSFLVERLDDGHYKGINLEEQKGPQLRISHAYLEALNDPATDAATKEFIKGKLDSAKQMMEDIKKRHEITQKIIDTVVSRQQDFFEKGIYWIKPLQQKELAQLLGIHRSTVSRAVSTKYVQTPKGLLSLKFLCPRDFKGHTSSQIKGLMISLLNDNPKLSDRVIGDLLKNEHGIDIKRRTVSKYRLELGLGSSRERKLDGN